MFTLHTSWPNVRRRNRLLLFVVAALFPVFVACGEASAASLPPTLRRLVRRLEVVPNGVDVERIDRVLEGATVDAPPSGRAGLVVSVGRLIGIKDPATVVAAFVRAARPEDRLVMVGEGELLSSLELYARRLPGEGGVFFTGLVPREEVHETLHRADVFVSASTVEGLPVAVLEAMVCRCLVVLSDIPAHREIASRTPSAQLVAPGDVAGFAGAIRRTADMRPAARLRAGEELRSCAVQHYSVRRMNVAYGHLYASIAHAGPRVARRSRRAASAVASPTVRKVAYVGTCALLGAGAAFGYARLHPPSFEAGVTLSVGDSSEPLTAEVVPDRTGSAADIANLVDRQPVLQPVAERLGVDDWRSLRARVETTSDTENPLLVHVTASAGSPAEAERLVAAVADELAVTGRSRRRADQAFAEHELDRIPLEIAAAQAGTRRASGVGGRTGRRARRAEADLRSMLSALHAGEKGILEWRSEAGQIRGLTSRTRHGRRPAAGSPNRRCWRPAARPAPACGWRVGCCSVARTERGPW